MHFIIIFFIINFTLQMVKGMHVAVRETAHWLHGNTVSAATQRRV